MEKTKLGISIGLLAAAVYFMGLINYTALILIAGYVLLFETNQWLRKSVVKAIAIVVAFSLINVVVGFGNDIFSFINNLIIGFGGEANLQYPLRLDALIRSVVDLALNGLLLIMGITALSTGSVAFKPVDKIIDRNM